MNVDEVHEASLRAFPLLRNVLLGPYPSAHVETEPVDGALLLDREWLTARVDEAMRLWGTADRRVAATLWWYNASSTFVATGATALLVTGAAPDPRPETLRMTLRRTGYAGYPARVRSDRMCGAAEAFGAALHDGFDPVMRVLAGVSGAGHRPLWSVLTDSLANRLLVVARKLGGPDVDALAALSARVTGAAPYAPTARLSVTRDEVLEEVLGESRPVEYVRRGSCCLLYEVPGEGKCANCPRQAPDVRERRVLAAGGGT
ncbi:(2Fe-2S)-binding protein [Spongisporangium articulatum]|uniref:(2Fe-2S)-binding protein n=1 Tax=Spongisporangium articulatum TaxID=3362603 RepID=A0ABW8AU28_9ACTN